MTLRQDANSSPGAPNPLVGGALPFDFTKRLFPFEAPGQTCFGLVLVDRRTVIRQTFSDSLYALACFF